jgi:flagellar motor protein MotB
MRNSSAASCAAFVAAFLTVFSAGCAGSPFSMPMAQQSLRPGPSPAVAGPYQEMQARIAGLDAQNQELHAQLAQQQQQTTQVHAALQRSQQQVAELRSQVGRDGATIAGNGPTARTVSHGGSLPVVNIPGTEVVPDGDLVRIRIESSQLFNSGQATLRPEVEKTLDRVASALRSEYAGRLVGIEGHTDSDPITKSKWKSNHDLAVARATAVFQALKRRGVPEGQLFVAGYGPNRPLASANDKARNRRVEIVVHPEPAR